MKNQFVFLRPASVMCLYASGAFSTAAMFAIDAGKSELSLAELIISALLFWIAFRDAKQGIPDGKFNRNAVGVWERKE